MTGRGVSCGGACSVGAVADAPPANASDTPAPASGKVLLRPFRCEAGFERAIAELSCYLRANLGGECDDCSIVRYSQGVHSGYGLKDEQDPDGAG